MNQLINIIIRTSNRPALFARCIESVRSQTYKNIQIIVGFDDPTAVRYIPIADNIMKVFTEPFCNYPFYYDIYCNRLKLMATDGWFFFLDDDDILTSTTVLQQLAPHLTEPGAIICQFIRNGIPKPRDNYIRHKVIQEGKIGLPCLVLHHGYKHIGQLDGQKGGDYRYIKEVTDQVPTKFIALPLVSTDRRSFGEMEANA
jgi:glycosyltransferase involved in cell wall biosynthesis